MAASGESGCLYGGSKLQAIIPEDKVDAFMYCFRSHVMLSASFCWLQLSYMLKHIEGEALASVNMLK
jgi:hypothetical protein